MDNAAGQAINVIGTGHDERGPDGHGGVLALTVTSKMDGAEGVVALTVAAPDGARLPDWAPGAHVDLVLPGGLTRQYSLCGDRWDTSRYRLAVLREPAGRGGSAYVHDTLRVGDLVGVGGPRNNFRLAPANRYLFIAGGIGITPILPMLHQAELVGAKWRLLYGGRRRVSMAFLDELAAYGDRVVAIPQDEQGLLPLPAWLGVAQPDTKVYCCGPQPLLDAVERLCAAWPPYTLRTERFVATEQPVLARSTPFRVVLARSRRAVTVRPGISVLAAVRAAGATVLSSCQQGVCGTCETTVLDGVPDHRDSVLSDHDRQAGTCMMICVSRSRTPELVLDL